MIVYGPVPSRRLGQSIGINNIPPKFCSYSCVYCQLGRTDRMQIERRAFYQPERIFCEAEIKMKQLDGRKEKADYFSFVPDGEPTLDINLGREIDLIKQFGIKVAVITNASLLWMDSVKNDLMKANWVSVSIDAADHDTWHKIDRPHGSLSQEDILRGIFEFSRTYKGTLVTETMLVDGINDREACVRKIAEQLSLIRPCAAYLLVPTRPPAEMGVKRASKSSVINAVRLIRDISGLDAVCITGDEKEKGFFVTETVADDLISIASVHPVREDIVDDMLKKRNADQSIVQELVDQGKLLKFTYEGKKFYRKNI
jgi:wyosine [tRNA(Phe)-imidazoG37] synthetase (radical SAM superfamily)